VNDYKFGEPRDIELQKLWSDNFLFSVESSLAPPLVGFMVGLVLITYGAMTHWLWLAVGAFVVLASVGGILQLSRVLVLRDGLVVTTIDVCPGEGRFLRMFDEFGTQIPITRVKSIAFVEKSVLVRLSNPDEERKAIGYLSAKARAAAIHEFRNRVAKRDLPASLSVEVSVKV
jgi:hypothetical protein